MDEITIPTGITMNNSSWGKLHAELVNQRQCLDMLNSAWITEYRSKGGVIYCRRGCDSCCTLAVNCTLTEAVSLAKSLSAEQLDVVSSYALRLRDLLGDSVDMKQYLRMQRNDMGFCPLLAADGSCTAYEARPLSCRSLLSTKESRWCGIDFATLTEEEKRSFITSLDPAETAFPLHYARVPQETGMELESRQLTLMKQALGYGCYGCMPVLVHLVHRHGICEAPSKAASETTASEAGFNNPLLVSWIT